VSQSNTTPAARAHTEALAAHEANEDAIAALKAQRAQLLEDETGAREALARGKSSPAILTAITENSTKAAALVPAIESLEASRPGLARAVDRAVGELWAEQVRELAPEGTPAAARAIENSLADQIREAVTEARTRQNALAAEAAHLEDQARRLHQRGALPRGVTYGTNTGVTVDGKHFVAMPGTNLGKQVGTALDTEYVTHLRAEAQLREAGEREAREAERATRDAEYAAARSAMNTTPAPR
jgi:hypothetical protein